LIRTFLTFAERGRSVASWPIDPTVPGEPMQDEDPAKSKRVKGTLLKMEKIAIQALQPAQVRG
jgi:hypothetical protein